MAVQNRDQVGWIDCFMCHKAASVHRSKIGRGGKKPVLYWRCGCGCIQPWGASGQAFVEGNMRPMDGGEKPAAKPAAKPAGEPTVVPAPAQETRAAPREYVPGEEGRTDTGQQEPEKKPAKRGFLDMLMGEE